MINTVLLYVRNCGSCLRHVHYELRRDERLPIVSRHRRVCCMVLVLKEVVNLAYLVPRIGQSRALGVSLLEVSRSSSFTDGTSSML